MVGVLQNPLGINLTSHDPVIDSPFVIGFSEGQSFPPPPSQRMITETGDHMITETTLDHMITEH